MSNPYEPSQVPQQSPQQSPMPGQSQSVSALDAVVPTNPLAAISCWCGIISLVLCMLGPLLGPIAIVTGVLSLRVGELGSSQYGKTASKLRSWIGIVTGICGTLVGLLFAVAMIASALGG